MFPYFLVNFLSYQCLENGLVTKVPALLEVLTSDFGIISLEVRNSKTINLKTTTVEISD